MESTEIDLTPYMNLLVVLAPFLLITAVFTRLAVLEIYLPPPASAELMSQLPSPDEPLVLTISITEKGLVVANGNKIISFVQPTSQGQDLQTLSTVLQQIKARFPTVDNAIILSKPDIAYDELVKVMDATRVAFVVTEGRKTSYSLFPNISLGEIQ
ncbi:MAG TPA: biopolymer transporter ExbD [Nitrospiria bacterium]|jgi:biopolymer transport protein ExbD|nr:biopolymer transporter ExbD [Nitrospiria bacterium]